MNQKMETETQSSTMPYYWPRRKKLLYKILRNNTGRLPVLHGLLMGELLWCERCDKILDVKQLEVHHVNGDAGQDEVGGGWQRLYQHEDDFENGVELQVLCSRCHCEVDEHRARRGL